MPFWRKESKKENGGDAANAGAAGTTNGHDKVNLKAKMEKKIYLVRILNAVIPCSITGCSDSLIPSLM